MTSLEGKIALVTGANSGIGFSTTKTLLKLGLNVIGLDIQTNNLNILIEEEPKSNLFIKKADVSDEVEVKNIFQWIDDAFNGLNVLIYCAGITGTRSLLDGAVTEWKNLMNINVIGMCLFIAESIKLMQKRNIENGQIIVLSSNVANFVINVPFLHFYCATKSSVKALVEGFRQELIGTSIKITSISPGLVKSEIFSSLGENIVNNIYKQPSLTPDEIANTISFILNLSNNVQIHDINVKPIGSIN